MGEVTRFIFPVAASISHGVAVRVQRDADENMAKLITYTEGDQSNNLYLNDDLLKDNERLLERALLAVYWFFFGVAILCTLLVIRNRMPKSSKKRTPSRRNNHVVSHPNRVKRD